MLADIQKGFDALEKDRLELIERLKALTSETRRFKAGPDAWSILEVIQHLVISEQPALGPNDTEGSSKLLDPALKSPEKFERVMKVLTRDIPVDVPDKDLEPDGQVPWPELLERWAMAREKLKQILENVTAGNREQLVSSHAYAGPLTAIEMLQFTEAHYYGHVRQIDRIQNKVAENAEKNR